MRTHPIFWLFNLHAEVPRADSLLFLHNTARAKLAHMGDRVDQEVAISQQDKEIGTEAAWQAHYILWGLIMGILILDPCGHQKGTSALLPYTSSTSCQVSISGTRTSWDWLPFEDMRLASTRYSGYKAWKRQSIHLTPTTWWASSSTTLTRKRISQDSIARFTAISSPSCFESWTYLIRRIWNSAP